jgi:hypothetical protein
VLKKSVCLLSIVVPLVAGACTSQLGEGEGETEPQGASQDELRSAVSCAETAATGYKSGAPYAMSVITVGGKPTSKPTAHAFLKMQQAADSAGVTLSINSGFRSMAEQQHLYNCYKTGSCNNGNLAARPGYSNHQNGRALDLATSNWTWVANNASRFGFKRTVPSERWHYEYSGADPGGPCSGGAAPKAPPVPDDSTAPDPNADPNADPTTGTVPTPTPRPAGADGSEADPSTNTGDVPLPPAKPADAGGSGCWSPTMNKTMEQGSCVQSSADDVMYQCHDGLWYRNVVNGKGRYGACTSIHAL